MSTAQPSHPEDTELQARTRSYDLAYRMEATAPEAVDLSKETDATKALYGLNDEATKDYGTSAAARPSPGRTRRALHPGRVGADWRLPATAMPKLGRAPSTSKRTTARIRKAVDKPIAGLLADLEVARPAGLDRWSCGPLNSAARPTAKAVTGAITIPGATRNGSRAAASRLARPLARPTKSVCRSVEKKVDTYDLHATVLQLLGLDHLKTDLS